MISKLFKKQKLHNVKKKEKKNNENKKKTTKTKKGRMMN